MPETIEKQLFLQYFWSFVFKAYAGAISATLQASMSEAAASEMMIDETAFTMEQQQQSKQLYYLLVLLVKDRGREKKERDTKPGG